MKGQRVCSEICHVTQDLTLLKKTDFTFSDNGGNETTVTVSLFVSQFRSVMFVSKFVDILFIDNISFVRMAVKNFSFYIDNA